MTAATDAAITKAVYRTFCYYLAEAGVTRPDCPASRAEFALLEAGIMDGRISDAGLVAYSRLS